MLRLLGRERSGEVALAMATFAEASFSNVPVAATCDCRDFCGWLADPTPVIFDPAAALVPVVRPSLLTLCLCEVETAEDSALWGFAPFCFVTFALPLPPRPLFPSTSEDEGVFVLLAKGSLLDRFEGPSSRGAWTAALLGKADLDPAAGFAPSFSSLELMTFLADLRATI